MQFLAHHDDRSKEERKNEQSMSGVSRMEQILGQFKIIEKQSDEDADDSPTKKIYDHH